MFMSKAMCVVYGIEYNKDEKKAFNKGIINMRRCKEQEQEK